MLPNASDLEYFLEVARTGTISRAAEKLRIRQPSLTQAVRRLEDNLGVSLLIRSRKGVTLTEAGKRLREQACFLVQEWEQVRAAAQRSADCVQGEVSIGCHPTLALATLPQVLPALVRKFPKLQIKLVHAASPLITDKVVAMEVDLGIVAGAQPHPSLVMHKLFPGEFSFWVGPGKDPVQDPLSGDAVLICEPDADARIIGAYRRRKYRYKRVIETSSVELAARLTAEGAGIGVLPAGAAEHFKPLGLRKLCDCLSENHAVSLIYRAEHKKVRAIREIASAIRAQYEPRLG